MVPCRQQLVSRPASHRRSQLGWDDPFRLLLRSVPSPSFFLPPPTNPPSLSLQPGIVQLPNSKDILLVLSCASFYTLTLGGENGIEPSEHPLPLTTTARDLFLKERKEGTVGRNEGERIVGLMVVAEKPLELGWVSQ